ncbi:MAG: MFS transporter [Solirubrobacteraceae bacterium]
MIVPTISSGGKSEEIPLGHPAIIAAIGATFMVMGSATFVIAALPTFAVEMRASQTELTLIADAVPVVLAALLLPCGAALDRYGRRRGLIVGLSVMVLSLLVSPLATDATELIVARIACGIGAAIAFPGTLATITELLGERRRPMGVALWAGATMTGGAVALFVAGLCIELSGTDAMFLAVAALTVLSLVAVVRWVPETRAAEPPDIDVLGAVLVAVAVGALVFGIVEIPSHGVLDPLVAVPGGIGILAAAAFAWRSLTVDDPLLDLRVFARPDVALGFVAVGAMFAVSFGWFLLSFTFGASMFDLGPLLAATTVAVAGLTIIPGSLLGPVLAARIGTGRVAVLGMVVLAVGVAVLAVAGTTQDLAVVLAATLIFGAGFGIGQGPATQLIVDALPSAKSGLASALNDVSRELGGAFGLAITGSAFNLAYRSGIDGAPELAAVADDARASPAAGTVAAHAPGAPSAAVDAVHDAVARGWLWAHAFNAVLLLLVVVAIVLVRRRLVARRPPPP